MKILVLLIYINVIQGLFAAMTRAKSGTHFQNAARWELDPRVRAKLAKTEFPELHDIAVKVGAAGSNNIFLDALGDCYDISGSFFQFNRSRVILGLEDIFLITGLPVVGKCAMKEKHENYDELAFNLGISEEPKIKEIMLHDLKYLMHVNGKVEDRHVIGFVMYMIGTMIYPRTSFTVSTRFLQYLGKIEEICEYAWGAATLAHMCLQKLKVKDNDKEFSLAGLSIILPVSYLFYIL